jgi:hypothetical protein
MTPATAPGISVARQTVNFVRHFFEMCIPMCVGGFVLYFLAFTWLPDLAGWGSLRERFPEASLFVIALVLSAPMTAWMIFRGMPWRPTLEMAVVPFVLALLIVPLASIGTLSSGWLLIRWGELCGLSCVGMFGVMLFRLDLYTGRSGHHAMHTMDASEPGP